MSALAKLFVVVMMALIVYMGLQWLHLVTEWRPVPVCNEDSVLLGVGEFSYGRWEFFECGPTVDDIIYLSPDPKPTPIPEPAEFGGFNV